MSLYLVPGVSSLLAPHDLPHPTSVSLHHHPNGKSRHKQTACSKTWNYSTIVYDGAARICDSVCVFVYLAGTERTSRVDRRRSEERCGADASGRNRHVINVNAAVFKNGLALPGRATEREEESYQ